MYPNNQVNQLVDTSSSILAPNVSRVGRALDTVFNTILPNKELWQMTQQGRRIMTPISEQEWEEMFKEHDKGIIEKFLEKLNITQAFYQGKVYFEAAARAWGKLVKNDAIIRYNKRPMNHIKEHLPTWAFKGFLLKERPRGTKVERTLTALRQVVYRITVYAIAENSSNFLSFKNIDTSDKILAALDQGRFTLERSSNAENPCYWTIDIDELWAVKYMGIYNKTPEAKSYRDKAISEEVKNTSYSDESSSKEVNNDRYDPPRYRE